MLKAGLLMVAAGSVVAVGIGVAVSSPTIAVVGPILVGITAVEWRRARVRAGRRAATARLPAVVDQLIQQLRAGRSLAESCRLIDSPTVVGPAPDPLLQLLTRLRARRPLAEAAAELTATDDPDVQLIAATLRVLANNGGPAVPALQRLRHTLIGVVHGRQRAAAESSQALASATLLVLAPGLFAATVATIDAQAAALYLYEPLGTGCLAIAVGLSWGGWSWMHRIVGRAEGTQR